jgi:hypothetical protein
MFSFDNVQEAYWSMASALSEADGIDYTDPEEVQYPCIHAPDLRILLWFQCLFIYYYLLSGAARAVDCNSHRS